MSKENQWNKIKPTHQELEVFEIVKSQFVGELKIVRESVQGKWDYYIQYDYNGHKGSLNNYPFPSLKYCKEFVEEYEEYIIKFFVHLRNADNIIYDFCQKQEMGEIDMREY